MRMRTRLRPGHVQRWPTSAGVANTRAALLVRPRGLDLALSRAQRARARAEGTRRCARRCTQRCALAGAQASARTPKHAIKGQSMQLRVACAKALLAWRCGVDGQTFFRHFFFNYLTKRLHHVNHAVRRGGQPVLPPPLCVAAGQAVRIPTGRPSRTDSASPYLRYCLTVWHPLRLESEKSSVCLSVCLSLGCGDAALAGL
jgi:hypothetical protein